MGISIGVPQPLNCQSPHARQAWPPSERVTIRLPTERLGQLLREQQLHVEDFSCADVNSKECVRRLLLQLLSNH